MEQRSRRGAASTLISHLAMQTLRNDTTLGSGNFLDRALRVSHLPAAELLWLDRPIVLPDGSTYASFSLHTLDLARRSLAGWYASHGVVPHQVVAVCVGNGIAPFLHYLALVSLGATPALINPAMPRRTFLEYLATNRFERLVSDAEVLSEELRAQLAELDLTLLDASAIGTEAPRALPTWWPYEHADSALIMLSHTSGTTGLPKTVRFEHRQFFMGKRARLGQFAEALDDRFLTALPQSHSSAISHLETAVLQGIPTYVVSDPLGDSVRRALRIFRPTVVAAFPQTYASLIETGVAPEEFGSVRRFYSMGDAAHESHIRRILVGSPRARFIDAFGSSELGMALFRNVSTRDAVAPRRSIGRPVEVAVAKVLDLELDEEVKPGRVGLLAVRAPTITPGYWQSPETTAQAWRGGYFLTGDVGFCRDGEFYLIDRAVDVIRSAAGPLYTLALEEELQQVCGVCDVSVVGVPVADGTRQRVFALVLPDRGARAQAESIGRRVWSALQHAVQLARGPLPPEDLVVAIVEQRESLPHGATGKVLKSTLRAELSALDRALGRGEPAPGGFSYVTDGTRESRARDRRAAAAHTEQPSFV